MFLALLVITLITATAVSFITARVFYGSITGILQRIVEADIARAWSRYLIFAIYVVGISGGVRIYELERYIIPDLTTTGRQTEPLTLTTDRWILEIYRTIIQSLQAIAWMLLVFFVFALIAYVIIRIFEARKREGTPPKPSGEATH